MHREIAFAHTKTGFNIWLRYCFDNDINQEELLSLIDKSTVKEFKDSTLNTRIREQDTEPIIIYRLCTNTYEDSKQHMVWYLSKESTIMDAIKYQSNANSNYAEVKMAIIPKKAIIATRGFKVLVDTRKITTLLTAYKNGKILA